METINDLNGDLVNVFSILRDRRYRKRLIELVEGTPWSRAEFCDALVAMKVGKWASDAERAWTFLVATRQSRNGVAKRPSDWSRTVGRTSNGASTRTSNNVALSLPLIRAPFPSLIPHLHHATPRLKTQPLMTKCALTPVFRPQYSTSIPQAVFRALSIATYV